MKYQDVLTFWFDELDFQQWFQSSDELDQVIRNKFEETLYKARAGELAHWRETIEGRLAEIIVLDQFSRNIYRNQGEAFSSDDMALALAQEAVRTDEQYQLDPTKRSFVYMPFMHSESLHVQENYSLHYFKEEGMDTNLPHAISHYETILKFGRFPYRNKALCRSTTEEEQAYLSTL